MNNNAFTMNDKIDALTFANAMGLASGNNNSEDLSSALGFAQAMGLRVRPVHERQAPVIKRNIVPQLKFC